jgi:3-dehydroquinate synthase
VVCDENVARLYADQLAPLTSMHPTYVVAATEETKSFAGVGALVDWLIAQRAVRSSTIIAIGGGCIQDLVSFTAHLYYRGIAWQFLPTTVLSQSDSCIGAKSGINVLPFKNQLGVLHSPRRIMIADEFLGTLPDVEVESGYGEIVKLAVTSSRHFLPLLEAALGEGGVRNPRLLELTRASLAAKQEVIEEDEYETDLRRILNYGHSFGHALESIAGHQVPHGLGVLWGIDVINWLGVRWGVTSPDIAARLSRVIRENFDYVLPLDPTADSLLDMVARDKKVANGRMHFAVLVEEGEFVILPRDLDQGLRDEVAEYLETDYVFRRR